jgi:hypothetical protein
MCFREMTTFDLQVFFSGMVKRGVEHPTREKVRNALGSVLRSAKSMDCSTVIRWMRSFFHRISEGRNRSLFSLPSSSIRSCPESPSPTRRWFTSRCGRASA